MEAFETLSLCGEIAIAITGFAGVVHVFGERGDRTSPGMNPALFRMLFTGTLNPLALIAIALILESAAFERAATWRICSALHFASVCLFTTLNIRSGESRAFASARGAHLVLLGAGLVAVLSLINAIFVHEFWPFLVAICWGIALGLFSFTHLVFSARKSD